MPVADQAQIEFNGSMGARYIGDRSEGQSFIAGKDGFLEGIEVGFSGFIGGDFEVAIYEQSSTKPSAVNQWVLQVYPNKLGSLVLKNDNIDKNFNRYSSYFDVSSLGIPQAKGSEYFFSITPKGSDIPDPYGVDVFVKTDSSIPDPYPAGSRMTSYDGSTYYLYPDYDLYFKTYVSEEQRNRAPTSVDLTAISFDENIPAGSVVSTLITIDADEDDFFSYSFVAGDGDSDNSLFTIEGDKLIFLDSPNYETKSSYSIRIQTTDSGGLTFEAPLILPVTDLEEDNDIANYSPNREWTQLLGTPTSDYGFSVDVSEDGSVYMAGYTKGNLDGQSNSGNFDVFLSKYNHDGLKVWTRLIGNSGFQTAHSVSVDTNGAVYVTGYTSGNLHGQSNSGSNDVFLSKYNSDGSREWTKLIGSTSVDWGHSVSTADDGSVYVAGSTGGDFDGQTNSGGIDAFLTKYNSDGSREWTEILGSSSQVWVHSVSTSQDDAIYIAGDTRGNLDGKTINGERDAFLIKYDSNGTRLWTQLLGTSSDDYGYSVSAAEDGSIYLAGSTGGDLEGEIHSGGYSDAFLSKYNSDGSREWTQLLGSSQSEHVRSVSTTSDGSIYIAGVTRGDLDGQTHKGEGDAFLSKYTSDGIKEWTQLLGSSLHDFARSVSTFVDGSVYIAGYTQGDLDGQMNSGDMDAFLSKYRFNEPPLDFGISALSFSENLPSGSVVGIFSTTDPDVGDTFTYSFVDGAGDSDNALFVIDGDQLKIIDVPDFEVMPSYSIRVQAKDSVGQTLENEVTLNVIDVNEQPASISLSALTFDENISDGVAVATLSTSDTDSGDTHTYALVSGDGDADNNAFTIEGDQLKIIDSPDYEEKSSYSVRLQTKDSGGSTLVKSFTLFVEDLEEEEAVPGPPLMTVLTQELATALIISQGTDVVIPDNFTSIGNSAFDRVGSTPSALTSVVIPNSVTSIGTGAFRGTKLTSITIPDSVELIGDQAFAYSKLKSIDLGGGVTSIGDAVFHNNTDLTNLEIPDSVTSIGHGAFQATRLTNVKIPDGVKSIGVGAFANVPLTSVDLGNGVTSIDRMAFMNTYSLESIYIPDSVKSIASDAFVRSGLTNVSISEDATFSHLFPDSVEIIRRSSNASPINEPSFKINDVETHSHGLSLKLNDTPDMNVFRLYVGTNSDDQDLGLILTNSSNEEVNLSAHWEDDTKQLHLLSNQILEEGDYTLKIRADGLVSQSGDLLDGNGNGDGVDDYEYSFTHLTPDHFVSIGDTARSAGQDLSINGKDLKDGITGIPIHLSTTSSLLSVSGEISFDADLLKDVLLAKGSDLPSDWVVNYSQSSPGTLSFTISGQTAATGSIEDTMRLIGQVDANASDSYGSTSLIKATITDSSAGQISFKTDPGLVVNAYSGDTTGNGSHSSLDASRVQRVVVGLDSGFDAFDDINPVLIGDTTGNGSLSSLDASRIQQEVVGLPVDTFPEIPII